MVKNLLKTRNVLPKWQNLTKSGNTAAGPSLTPKKFYVIGPEELRGPSAGRTKRTGTTTARTAPPQTRSSRPRRSFQGNLKVVSYASLTLVAGHSKCCRGQG